MTTTDEPEVSDAMRAELTAQAAIERAGEQVARAADELDLAGQSLDTDVPEDRELERAAVSQAHALIAIAGYLGALSELALVALREPKP